MKDCLVIGSRIRAFDRENCSEQLYRPISLTSQISKVIEAVLRDAITAHLEQNCLIRDSQHGFRKGRSCLTNLLSFLDKVTDYVNEGTNIDIIYLDFAKSFDKVPHHRYYRR